MMQAFASQESYFDNYWDNVPIKGKMEAVKQVQEALVERGMPTMAEEDILQRLRKRANVEKRLRREHSGQSQDDASSAGTDGER
jgi:polyphosphate kinase 2 (PPK2 family)